MELFGDNFWGNGGSKVYNNILERKEFQDQGKLMGTLKGEEFLWVEYQAELWPSIKHVIQNKRLQQLRSISGL